MMDDNNKTVLTREITAAAVSYLDERGCKPIETEVWVASSWVADIAAVLDPTRTELVKLKLIPRRPHWGDPAYEPWKARLEEIFKLMTVIVEVKASRSDFLGDKKWRLAPPASLCYLAMPCDLGVDPSKYPVGWGLLTYDAASRVLRCTQPPKVNHPTAEQMLGIVVQIAERRDHHTRYARLREFNKECRARENAEASRVRVQTAMRALLSIVKAEHGNVAGALAYHGIKALPAWCVQELEALWGKATR